MYDMASLRSGPRNCRLSCSWIHIDANDCHSILKMTNLWTKYLSFIDRLLKNLEETSTLLAKSRKRVSEFSNLAVEYSFRYLVGVSVHFIPGDCIRAAVNIVGGL